MTISFDIAGMDELTGGRLATLDLKDTYIVIHIPRQVVESGQPVVTLPVSSAQVSSLFDDGEPTWEDAEWQ